MDNKWSTETIQERAASNWSLEGDNQLLYLMKSISKNLEERCKATNNNLNRLKLNLDKTNVKLGNATTKFLDLNNAKFVEHSVMDIDSLSNTDKCSTAGSDKAFVPLPKAIQDAVTNGLRMMDRCYEKVSLEIEDSDDDDDVGNGQKHVVCRPKNPYVNRPLPYLIGSKQWNEKWHIGLVESDEELLSDEELEEFSQSSEDGDSISISPQTSNPPTASESDFTVPTPTQNDFVNQSNDVENNSLRFGTDLQTNREKIKVFPTLDSNQNDLINDSVIKSKPSEPPKEYIFAQQKSKKAFVDLFDDEPPLMNEPIRNEVKPVNLFLDSDEEDDPKLHSKPTSIFNNNILNRHLIPDSIPRTNNVPKSETSKNLFHDDVDNNNIPATSKTAVKVQAAPKSTDFGSLFDDEPPDDFFDIIVKNKGKNVESSQYFDDKQSEKFKRPTKTAKLFESDDDDDDFSKIINDSTKSSVVPSGQKNSIENNEKNLTTVVRKNVEEPDAEPNTYSQYSPYRSNTGPPETYKSFLDDEPPAFDEEKEEEIFPVPQSSTTLHNTQQNDQFIPSSSTSKIIYDDVAETLNSLRTAKQALPPETTVSSTIQATSKANETQDETDQSESFKKNLSMFANPVSRPIVAVDKPKPNKLKTNFNINVAGLLPGAKLPSQKHTQTVTVSNDHIEEIAPKEIENVEKKLIVSRIKTTDPSSTTDDKSDLLTCLSKSRAKIQVRRRPSTRSGRKQLYNKSLITDSENVVKSVESTEDTISPVLISETRESDITLEKTEVDTGDWLTEVPTNNQDHLATVDDDDDWLKTFDDKSASANKTESNEDDWLSTITNEPKSSNKNLSHLMNYDWLIASSLPPEDINPPSNNSIDEYQDQDQDDWLTASYVTKEKPSTVVDLPSLEDDWLTATETKEKSSTVVDLPNLEDDWLTVTEREEKPSTVVDQPDTKDDWLTATERKGKPLTVDDLPSPEDDWLTVTERKGKPSTVKDRPDTEDDWLTATERKGKPSTVDDLPSPEDDWLTVTERKGKPSTVDDLPSPKDDWLTVTERKGKPSTTVDDLPSPQDDWLTVTERKEKPSTVIDRLDTEDDWLTATERKGKPSAVADLPNRLTAIETRRQQSDENIFSVTTSGKHDYFVPTASESKPSNVSVVDKDDNDWLSQSTKSQAITAQELNKTSVSPVKNQSPSKQNVIVQSPENIMSKPRMKQSTLFDDDDDDDDLFTSIHAKQSKAKPSNSKKNEPVKSTKNVSIKSTGKGLFSDEEDSDGDDLFSSSRSKPKKNQNNQKVLGDRLKSNSTDKRFGAGLFNDEEDDDDDIFSSKVQKPVSQPERSKKSSITKLVSTIPAANDPLINDDRNN